MNLQNNITKKIFFCANNFFVLYNFRFKIISEFVNKGFEVALVAEKDGYEKKFERLIKKNNIYSFKKNNILFDFFNFVVLNSRVFFTNRNSIFYTFTAKSNILYGFLNYIKKKPLIANITGLGIIWDYGFLNYFFKFLLFISLRNAKIIFVQNQRDLELFQAIMKKANVEIIKINGSGVNLKTFNNESYKRKFKKISFAMVSRLKSRKGFRNYLEACELISPNEMKNCSFKFVPGYGSNKKILKKINLQYPNVEIMKFNPQINQFLRKVDCFIYPSKYNEGTPKILLEALASGCAIITTNQPGCVETIEDCQNGFVLESNNPKKIAKAIKRYLNLSIEEKKRFSMGSRLIAENKFDEKFILAKYLYSLMN